MYELSVVEKRQFMALVKEREHLVSQVQGEIAEIENAMNDIVERLAEREGLEAPVEVKQVGDVLILETKEEEESERAP